MAEAFYGSLIVSIIFFILLWKSVYRLMVERSAAERIKTNIVKCAVSGGISIYLLLTAIILALVSK